MLINGKQYYVKITVIYSVSCYRVVVLWQLCLIPQGSFAMQSSSQTIPMRSVSSTGPPLLGSERLFCWGLVGPGLQIAGADYEGKYCGVFTKVDFSYVVFFLFY
ncbi:MAG: hypothetical protein IPN08_08380 [Bacteroidales bacterium]|nr:hypothetical protein [Bacteroidales bacterium]